MENDVNKEQKNTTDQTNESDNSVEVTANQGLFVIIAVVLFGVLFFTLSQFIFTDVQKNLESVFESIIDDGQDSLGVKSKYNLDIDKALIQLNQEDINYD